MASGATGSSETRVNSTFTNETVLDSDITALADGGWVVTWYATDTALSGHQSVEQQRYDESGNAVGDAITIDAFTVTDPGHYQGLEYQVSTSTLADGGWVVNWTSYGNSQFSLHQQRYAADGSEVGDAQLVNTFSTFTDLPGGSVTALADGGWVVAWTDYLQSANVIRQQRFDAAGEAVGSPTNVNATTDANTTPSTTALSDGGWVVTWVWDQHDGSYGGIYQQRFGEDGEASSGIIRVNTYTAASQDSQAVTALADGGWLVTWQSNGQDTSAYGIYEQRYDRSGATVGGEIRVNTTTAYNQNYPSVATLADGGWVVTWESSGQDGNGFGIVQQRYDADGRAIGGETIVNIYTTGYQDLSTVTALADGGWVVTWNGADADTPTKTDVFQRHFAADVVGSRFGENLQGTSWGELLIGYGGNDTLDGKGGADVMIGGMGNDTYVVNNAGDDVQEMAGQGIDTIKASITISLEREATVENVTLTGSSAINATGNGLANTLVGNNATNKISGLGGADVIDGGKGNDTLTGGAGADHFLFKTGGGKDTIGDFIATGKAHDLLDLSAMDAIKDFDDLKANHMTQHGDDVWIIGSDNDKIVLKNVDLGDLGKADFVF